MAKAPLPEHKDKLGHLIAVGDYVAYPASNALKIGRVAKINAKMIGINRVPVGRWKDYSNKYPEDVVKLDEKEMTFYLLKNAQ